MVQLKNLLQKSGNFPEVIERLQKSLTVLDKTFFPCFSKSQ